MDLERIWKGVERSAAIIGAVCAVATVYYTMGVYYGWDKQEAAKVGSAATNGGIHMSIPWPIVALGLLATLAILASWVMIVIRLRGQKGAVQKFEPHSGMISLNEIEFNTGRLSQPAPWLELYLTFFNASGFDTRPFRIAGRVKVSGQEFHSHIELIDTLKACGNNQFFRVGLKIPLSASEAEYCLDSIRRRNLSVDFSGGIITFGITIYGKSGPAPEINFWLPRGVGFNPESLRTDPYLPWHNPLNVVQSHTL
jgi:hypothetical protein